MRKKEGLSSKERAGKCLCRLQNGTKTLWRHRCGTTDREKEEDGQQEKKKAKVLARKEDLRNIKS